MHPTERIREIDWLKGFAILCVIWIHAKPFENSLFYLEIVDRAVPIFLVLFGVSSELWWNRAAAMSPRERLAKWYRERFARLMVPLWTTVTLCWLAALISGAGATKQIGWSHLLAAWAGFAPWIGPSWFVTIILQLVLVFPLLHWLAQRLGVLSILLAAVVSALSVWHLFDILILGRRLFPAVAETPTWYYFWIFSPRAFWHVTAGIFIARAGARPNGATTAVAAALAVASVYLEPVVRGPADVDLLFGPVRQQLLMRLADVPVTLALLGVIGWLRPLPRVTEFLAFCGTASWGIYLGHMLIHELVHMRGLWPDLGPVHVRIAYWLLLFTGGTLLTLAGTELRRRVASLVRTASA
jgi:peptidoglycan/LPS O-acetylase OafA/YrhL